MRIERVEELFLTSGQETAIAKLLTQSFTVDFEGRSYFQNRHHCRFLYYDETTLVGHLGLCYRAIQLGDQRINIIGIGEVAVRQEARRQGIGFALLNAAIKLSKESQAGFVLLFGEQSIYEAAGFVPAPNTIKLVEMEGARTKQVVEENNPNLMVLSLGERQRDTSVNVDLAGFAF
ncbi:MAG: GNAT family N-acetyltransferase [Rhizobiaceae bacterium]